MDRLAPLDARGAGTLDCGAVTALRFPAPDLIDFVCMAGSLGREATLVRLVGLRASSAHPGGAAAAVGEGRRWVLGFRWSI
uniref:Uncharacterized protein n=1 Tax=Arundo donax TaxID=35708 RepID=A0A0A9EXG5_ARUDO